MTAVIPVRGGVLPAGAAEAVAEAGGSALVAGDRAFEAAQQLAEAGEGRPWQIAWTELGDFAPAHWADRLAPLLLDEEVVILPAVPDGRDLAPRLAAALGRPLLAGASRIGRAGATVLRRGGLQAVEIVSSEPYVATLLPGVRSVGTATGEPARGTPVISEAAQARGGASDDAGAIADARSIEVLAPDPASIDLGEARRIVAGGAGLGREREEFTLLERVAAALGASVGATRVVTDGGLLDHGRQIGTTGVSVRPRVYVALGISGAAQHVGGLGEPEHVISVNLDPSCPMMSMADLAIVSDARETLAELARRLGIADE
ncbi:MAG: mycofactocin-associated electron transfer flavoprotein alpha subunit [Acidimicrobiales bacterium]